MPGRESWPGLVGMPADEAVVVIQRQKPYLEVIPVPEGSRIAMDFRQDRVRVFFDDDYLVSSVPRVG
ncbi:unnamed protein product [Rotaria sordida]|uniref:Uncharacterized protein n=1 Tax=Rotaria sordida TaxID=392033 RepID=A0A815AKR3_9BILA|nr:unnamed protein product [Rotaria sordida]CAF4198080.1 unnamed protein product [Rotaria sordida]